MDWLPTPISINVSFWFYLLLLHRQQMLQFTKLPASYMQTESDVEIKCAHTVCELDFWFYSMNQHFWALNMKKTHFVSSKQIILQRDSFYHAL